MDGGPLEHIVRRPAEGEREVLAEAMLDPTHGLVGDTWLVRGSSSTADGSSHPDKQITVMNWRVAALLSGRSDQWQLAGDQLYVDLDLSEGNLPPGTRLDFGSAIVEVSDQPHLGCKKFSERFGLEALRFVNSPIGRQLRLRGLNAKVVVAGGVHVGDVTRKIL
jgi:MOSC domain-containing protein YiiM